MFYKQCKEMLLRRGIWLLIAGYVVFLSWLTALKYAHFLFHDFDLAIHAQTVWNILHGSTFSSILGMGFLGNHTNFISFILAPFYAVFPTPVTLLVLQTAALGFTAYPLFLIAREFLSARTALYVGLLYLIYPGTLYTNLFEFHPTPFAALFLAWMIYYFIKGDLPKFCFHALLAMLCQENISLIVLMTGPFALIERRPWRWVLIPLLAGAAYFLVCVKILMPHFAAGKVDFFSLYAHLGRDIFDVIVNLFAHPGKVMALLTSPDRLEYLVALFIPLSFIPLLGSRALLPLVAIFLQHMLSSRMTERSLEFHYTVEMLPFIFLALILGLRALLPRPKILRGAMALAFICSALTFIQGPYEKFTRVFSGSKDTYPAALKEQLLKKVPPDASLVATFDFLPKASHRAQLYSFHHIYWGYYTLSSNPYPLPPSVDYALLDVEDGMTFGSFYHPRGYLNFRRFLDTFRLVPVSVRDNFVLFSRYPVGGVELFMRSPSVPQENAPLFTDGAIRLNKINTLVRGDVLYLDLEWQAELETEKDIGLYLEFIDEKGVRVRRLPLAVCYRIFPTQAWRPGERVVDRKELTVPADLSGRSFLIRIGFFDQITRRILAGEVLVPVNKGD